MATFDLQLTDLNTRLQGVGISGAVIAALDNHLEKAGDFTGSTDTIASLARRKNGYIRQSPR